MLWWFLFAGLGRVVGRQGSFHNEIEDSDPTILISLLLTRNLAETILCHPYDRDYDLIGSRGDAFLKYCLLKNRENIVFGFSINRQNCFPSIVVLKILKFFNPIPTSSLLWHNLSHDFQCILLYLSLKYTKIGATALVSFFFF